MEPSHYAGTDAIAKQEAVAARLVEMGVPADRAFCAATALKYVERCGRKRGASAEDDMGKAANYMFRAISGRWPWEGAVETDPVLAADGLPLREGDTVYHVEDGSEMTVYEIDGEWLVVSVGGRVRHDIVTHRTPVLAADGKPLREGETVWDTGREQHEYIVLGQPGLGGGAGRFKVTCHDVTDDVACYRDPSQLTHERPDSWKRIEEDLGDEMAKQQCGPISPELACKLAGEFVRRCRALAERDVS